MEMKKGNNNYPNYSVLMSIYEKEDPNYFSISIDSMIAQSITPKEIVIVKDGKLTSDLEKVIDDFCKQYPKLFNIISLDENVGLGRALDIGLKHCTCELVARMDTDDISLPKRCELELKEFMNDKNLDIIGTSIDEFYDDPKVIVSKRKVPSENEQIVEFIKRRSPFNHPTVMYKKTKVLDVGGYGKMKRKQDLDLFSRMINAGCIGKNIDESLVLFRSNKDSYKRRKSFSYCKSYIEVQFQILKRGNCSLFDFLYVFLGQTIFFLIPTPVFKKISDKYLRHN